MKLTERKQALLNQMNQIKAEKAEAEKAVAEFDTGIKRLEGALILIDAMEKDEKAVKVVAEPKKNEGSTGE